jgi:hypothetical protein
MSGPSGIGYRLPNVGWKARNFGRPISRLEARLIPNPIRKVLSSMRAHRVRSLLMGGQACVLYGAAEFSRDTDFVVLADAANLSRLQRALVELRAERIAVPPFELKYLRRGHAIHFRCQHPEALRMRVDVMSKMRGVEPFGKLWLRRTTVELADKTVCDLISLPDLVRAKKTQRDKDWPMIRRLLEASYFQNSDKPNAAQVRFWLLELRSPSLLIELAGRFPSLAKRLVPKRRLLADVISADIARLELALAREETAERKKDKRFWSPLRKELEKLRHEKC